MIQYNTDKKKLEKKIEDVDKKIEGVSGFVTTTVLIAKISKVKNKIPEYSGLVKKREYEAKILEIELRHFTSSENNKFRSDIIETKINKKN